MNAEKLREKITFKTRPLERGMTHVRATLVISVDSMVDTGAVADNPNELLQNTEENMKDQLLRYIYEDQRQELYGALQDFMMVEPFNYAARRDAESRLLLAAMRQGPRERSK